MSTTTGTSTTGEPLTDLTAAGVSIWLDDLSRGLIESGGLADLVADSQVTGVTTNPTIFEMALREGQRYADQINDLATRGVDVDTAIFELTTRDVRNACDVLRPVYDRSDGVDGRVSIEVEPGLAHDTDGTVAMARRLWAEVDRPNLHIKIPATIEGLPAISTALAEGISINVTLIFSLDRYRAVMQAFLVGLEQAREKGLDLSRIESVASFFVSRVDAEIDPRLDEIGTPEAVALKGRAGIANARLAYHAWTEVFSTPRWRVLADEGGHPQRPLWASTGVKNPDYSPTMYVDQLVAAGCVNTMPSATLRAVAEGATITGDTITGTEHEADAVLDDLEGLGISYTAVTEQLEREGVDKFNASWAQLQASIGDALARAAVSDGVEEAGQ